MNARRLCLTLASLSLCAIAHATTLQTGEIMRSIPTDQNFEALSATLVGLTALGMFLSFRRPLWATPKPAATTQV